MKQKLKTKKGDIKLPVMEPILIPIEKVISNDYNPNHVSKQNMNLLMQSIIDNGFCFPIVTVYDDILDRYVIVDGFHRYIVLRDYLESDMIPIVVLDHDISQRMAATVQFNRARGVHQVDEMAELVRSLVEHDLNDEEIAKHLGMDIEEVYRLKQITGIAEMFKNQSYSKSWEMQEVEEEE